MKNMIKTYAWHRSWKVSKITMCLVLVSLTNVILLNSLRRFSPIVLGKAVRQESWQSSCSIPPQRWLPGVDLERITQPLWTMGLVPVPSQNWPQTRTLPEWQERRLLKFPASRIWKLNHLEREIEKLYIYVNDFQHICKLAFISKITHWPLQIQFRGWQSY